MDTVTLGPPHRRVEKPVYDGARCAPDVSQLAPKEQLLWVLADSVWGRKKVDRPIVEHGLLSIWDYEGKLEARKWDSQTMRMITTSRLKSPPSKILRAVCTPAFDYLMAKHSHVRLHDGESNATEGRATTGRTTDIPHSPLERKEEAGRAAAMEDHAAVDLSVWALPDETPVQASARETIRKRAVAWWAFNVERDAKSWLRDHPEHTERDVEALDDCVRRARAHGGQAVGPALAEGSPAQDYTRPSSGFIKSDQGDIDVGEMFHNFMVHESERHALGIRHMLTSGDGTTAEKTVFRRFTRLHFGGKGSPYCAFRGQVILLDICKGDHKDEQNLFHWQRVHCNLPTNGDFDPSMPRVLKLRSDGELACRKTTFVDDIHVAGRRQENSTEGSRTRHACKRLKARMNHLGNQDDDRKYRDVSMTPGPWNGGILHTDTPFPMESTTGKKCVKFRHGLEWILEQAETHTEIATAALRRITGLGINVTEIYPEGRPYLKGMFNALEAWRGWRDVDG